MVDHNDDKIQSNSNYLSGLIIMLMILGSLVPCNVEEMDSNVRISQVQGEGI